MSPRLPNLPSRARLRAACARLAAACLAVCALGSTCDNQDYSPICVVSFGVTPDSRRADLTDPDLAEECRLTADLDAVNPQLTLESTTYQEYDARTVVDFRVKNTTQTALKVIVRAESIKAGRSLATPDDAALDASSADSDGDGIDDISLDTSGDASTADASEDASSADADAPDASPDAGSDASGTGGETITEDVCVSAFEITNTNFVPNERTLTLTQFGEWRAGRFGEDELQTGIGVKLSLEVICFDDLNCVPPTGSGEFEYTVLAKQYECRVDNDCASDQLCDTTLGRCVGRACGPQQDCPDDQTCDEDLCRCVDTGLFCAVPPGQPMPWDAPLWVALGLLGLVAARRRAAAAAAATAAASTSTLRRRPRRALLGALALAAALAASAPDDAHAQRRTFDRPTSSLYAGAGTRFLVGRLGQRAGTGLELYFGQSLQYRYLGMRATIGTSYFLTNQIPPPLSRGLQLFSVRLSPRLIFPLWQLRLFFDVLEYERVGIISNALVRETGPDLHFNAIGGAAGIHWEPQPYLIVGVRTAYNHFVDFPGLFSSTGSFSTGLGGIVSTTLQFGIQGGI